MVVLFLEDSKFSVVGLSVGCLTFSYKRLVYRLVPRHRSYISRSVEFVIFPFIRLKFYSFPKFVCKEVSTCYRVLVHFSTDSSDQQLESFYI